MYNWSVNSAVLKKYPHKYLLWKLEQLINFGLGKEKIKRSELKKNLHRLRIDPMKKSYLKFLLGRIR